MRKAGNSNPMRVAGTVQNEDGLSTSALGRPMEGGIRGWWFCGERGGNCNGRTGVWDEEFQNWWKLVGESIHFNAGRLGPTHVGQFSNADPGRFIRAVWAWMFALDETLVDSHDDLAAAVRFGYATDPPKDICLLLGVTTSLRIWVSAQRDSYNVTTTLGGDGFSQHRSGIWAPTPEVVEQPRVVVSAPPFIAVLASGDNAQQLPLTDVGVWLRESTGLRRQVDLSLPFVHVRRQDVPTPIAYSDIVVDASPAPASTRSDGVGSAD